MERPNARACAAPATWCTPLRRALRASRLAAIASGVSRAGPAGRDASCELSEIDHSKMSSGGARRAVPAAPARARSPSRDAIAHRVRERRSNACELRCDERGETLAVDRRQCVRRIRPRIGLRRLASRSHARRRRASQRAHPDRMEERRIVPVPYCLLRSHDMRAYVATPCKNVHVARDMRRTRAGRASFVGQTTEDRVREIERRHELPAVVLVAHRALPCAAVIPEHEARSDRPGRPDRPRLESPRASADRCSIAPRSSTSENAPSSITKRSEAWYASARETAYRHEPRSDRLRDDGEFSPLTVTITVALSSVVLDVVVGGEVDITVHVSARARAQSAEDQDQSNRARASLEPTSRSRAGRQESTPRARHGRLQGPLAGGPIS